MSDLIDRQAAIDAINSGMLTDDDTQFECPSECNSMLEWAVNAVKELPTAEKKGKWISEAKGKVAILDEFGNVSCSAHCSECGEWLTASDEYSCRGNYCPNCGARMTEESE